MDYHPSDYVLLGKRVLGDQHMSDREFGEQVAKGKRTYHTSKISDARYGRMGDALAIDIGELLESKGAIADAGEVLLVARVHRETDERARSVLLRYAKKALASVPARAVTRAVGALTVVLGMLLSPPQAEAGSGGVGR